MPPLFLSARVARLLLLAIDVSAAVVGRAGGHSKAKATVVSSCVVSRFLGRVATVSRLGVVSFRFVSRRLNFLLDFRFGGGHNRRVPLDRVCAYFIL